MTKKIAVLVRDRQSEAVRMSVGLTLMDDVIDVYVLDGKLEDNEENALNVELLQDLDMSLYSNHKENTEMQYLSTEEIARKLPEYDHVLAY
ncbi:MAG: hypothetical protein HKM94_02880 [Halobacteria archaeon]|nr:hypothetical protein [Halobacteria archaeon]